MRQSRSIENSAVRGEESGTALGTLVESSMGRIASFLIFFVCATGCAHAATARPSSPVALRVLVVDPRLETELDTDTALLGAALARGLAREGGLVPADASGTELPEPSCLERLACLRELGRLADADFVAATLVTGLGDTAMVRVRLVDVRETGAEQTRQTVVQPAESSSLAAAIEAMGAALAAPFAPRTVASDRAASRRARFRWLGPLLAVGLAGAATGTYLLVRPSSGGPDVVIVPP